MIKEEDLKDGCFLMFTRESIQFNYSCSEGVYRHLIGDEKGSVVANFTNRSNARTTFIIERSSADIVKLRSICVICDNNGSPCKEKCLNFSISKEKLSFPGMIKLFTPGQYADYCANMPDYERMDIITHKMFETYIRKNHDYGNAFSEIYDELGINYGYGKIREKVNRIKTLKDGDAMVENEPLEDALLDCANYCILTLMEYQKHKEHGKD